jgi:hypothetical protein
MATRTSTNNLTRLHFEKPQIGELPIRRLRHTSIIATPNSQFNDDTPNKPT